MDRRTLVIAAGSAGLLLPVLSVAALAQSTATTTGQSGARATLAAIATAGTASLQASQLAVQKAQTANLRQFAELEAEEQQNMMKALQAAGEDPGRIELPAANLTAMRQLQQASGSEFEQLYLQDQIAGHQGLLQLNELHLQQAGTDAHRMIVPLMAIPAIKSHLAMLQMIRLETAASGSTTAQ